MHLPRAVDGILRRGSIPPRARSVVIRVPSSFRLRLSAHRSNVRGRYEAGRRKPHGMSFCRPRRAVASREGLPTRRSAALLASMGRFGITELLVVGLVLAIVVFVARTVARGARRSSPLTRCRPARSRSRAAPRSAPRAATRGSWTVAKSATAPAIHDRRQSSLPVMCSQYPQRPPSSSPPPPNASRATRPPAPPCTAATPSETPTRPSRAPPMWLRPARRPVGLKPRRPGRGSGDPRSAARPSAPPDSTMWRFT